MPTDPTTAAAAEALARAAEAAAKMLPVEKVYVDGFQGVVREIGAAGTDIVKTARLLLAPFQIGAAYQERLARYCKRLQDKVPEERRQEVPARVSGPILEALRYFDEQDLVTEYMVNLLAAAMDSARGEDVHPAFSTIAVQLCTDEAMILFHLKKNSFDRKYTQRLMQGPPVRFELPVFESNDFPLDQLAQPHQYGNLISHLYNLGLAWVVTVNTEYLYADHTKARIQTGIRKIDRVELTEFGRMFATACVPDELPQPERL